MANALDDDDWERVKLGRFTDADERLVRRVMGPWFLKRSKRRSPQNKSPSSSRRKLKEHQTQVLANRGNTVSLGFAYQPRKQAVVRVRFCPKSRSGVMNLVRYVARLRPKDRENGSKQPLPLWDGYGDELDEAFALKLPQHWDLPSDEENYSKRARGYIREGNISALNQMRMRDRLRNIQVWHFTLSIKEGEFELYDRFHAAVLATVDNVFTAEGHDVLWTIHSEHSDHLHAHMIVKALSEFGGRLHSDIHGDFLQYLREKFASNLQRAGLDYEASRRIDREPLRDKILSGCAPLREERLPWRKTDSSRDPYENLLNWAPLCGDVALQNVKRLKNIRRQVQDATQDLSDIEKWAAAAHLLRKHLDKQASPSIWRGLLGPKKKAKEEREGLTVREQMVLHHFEKGFHNPRQALESWRFMASDGAYRSYGNKIIYPNYNLAVWTLLHRPELFGRVKADGYVFEKTRTLTDLLKTARLWSPERLPQPKGKRIGFCEHRRRIQAMRGQASVISGLTKLRNRIHEVWPDSQRELKLAQAIRRSKRTNLDNQALVYMPPAANDEPSLEQKPSMYVRSKPVASGGKPMYQVSQTKPKQRRHTPSKKSRGIER